MECLMADVVAIAQPMAQIEPEDPEAIIRFRTRIIAS